MSARIVSSGPHRLLPAFAAVGGSLMLLAAFLGDAAPGNAGQLPKDLPKLPKDLPKLPKDLLPKDLLKLPPVAKATTEAATWLRRLPLDKVLDKDWQIVKAKEDLHPGEMLLAGNEAALETNNGAVRLAVHGDMCCSIHTTPVLETALILLPPGDSDLEFALLRGRIELTNTKAKGAAKIKIRGPGESCEIVLEEPGTKVALEIFGRWPRGTHFHKVPKPDERPSISAMLLVLKGEAEVKGPHKHFNLKAPPGPALIEVDDLGESDAAVKHLDKLPAWATEEGNTDRAKLVKATLAKFRKLAVAKSVPQALDELSASDQEVERTTAIYLMGATDDLERLGHALTETKHADVWNAGVLALRHWIGRAPGQDQKLFLALTTKGKFKPGEAETTVQLLHSFGDDDLSRPETYEFLIDLLDNDRLALRGLAHWHLHRLVPAGRKLAFNPWGSKEERTAAVEAWRKLVPPGKLPPKATVADK
ncbi:MAG: hypothetical protein JNM56_11170 [Planctomycetia bacterium]|nr:hypothetical protein [Planctomycetia bacterium]